MRAAAFLARGKSRSLVAKKVKQAYDARSAISHGGDWQSKIFGGRRNDLLLLTDVLETYLRYTIRGCLGLETLTRQFKREILDDPHLEAEGSEEFSRSFSQFQDEFKLCLFCNAVISRSSDYCDVCSRRQESS